MEHTEKLNRNRDFVWLYHHGTKIVSPYMILYVKRTGRNFNRIGVRTGKKLGHAVVRNRARRIILAAYRETEASLPVGMDLVIVALPAINGMKETTLKEYFLTTGRKRFQRALENPSHSAEK